MKILVTDGNSRAALAIVRSLGRKGYNIVVGAIKHPSLASCSKYCAEHLIYPDPEKDQQRFIDVISDFIKTAKVDIILPVTDITTILVTHYRVKLEQYCHVPFADNETIVKAASKDKMMRIASEINIPIPKTFYLESINQIDEYDDSLGYPVVLKPARSRIRTVNGFLSTSVGYAADRAGLEYTLRQKSKREFPILLQERITGPGVGVFVCYNKGKLVACFGHKRLREKPPSGGVSTLRESIAVHPKALEFSKLLLDYLKWHGVAMVEFKLDVEDDTPKLMEINGRFWGSLQLAIDSGVDFPEILAKTINNDHIEQNLDYQIGVKTRWLLGDMDALIAVLTKKRKNLNLPDGFGSKFRYLIQFLKIFQHNMKYEVESFSDMRPGMYELTQWLMRKSK